MTYPLIYFRIPYFITLLIFSFSIVHAQKLDPTFKAETKTFGFEGPVSDIEFQPDDKIIVAGDFQTIYDFSANGLARFNPDGTIDKSFDASGTLFAFEDVKSVALQADGKILAGGRFGRNVGNNTQTFGLFRFNPDGTRDNTFQPYLPSPWRTETIIVQPDGKILVGWAEEIQWLRKYHLARLNADGSKDDTFNCDLSTDMTLNDIALQPDGKILVVGGSTISLQNALLLRFNADGSPDVSFTPPPIPPGNLSYSWIDKVWLADDGDIFINGSFKKCGTESRANIAKLSPSGQLRPFKTEFKYTTEVVGHFMFPDGRIMLTGGFEFDTPDWPWSYAVIVNADGSLNDRLNQVGGQGNYASLTHLYGDRHGKIMITNARAINWTFCGPLARLDQNMTLDASFRIGPAITGWAHVSTLAVQNDGKIIASGNFRYVDQLSRNCIARLNFDGSVDPTFDPGTGVNGTINAILIQPDGKIILAGNFTHFNKQPRKNLVRLNSDGSVDQTFVGDGSMVKSFCSIAIQKDEKIVLLEEVMDLDDRYTVRRLNTDGSIDQSFLQPPYWYVVGHFIERSLIASRFPIGIQPDGKILVEHLRLNIDGTRDQTYQPKAGTAFVALEPDGKIILRGGNYGHAAESMDGLHRVNEDGSLNKVFNIDIQEYKFTGFYRQSNGKMILNKEPDYGSDPTTYRLLANGEIDHGFDGRNLLSSSRVLIPQTPNLILACGYPTNDPPTTPSIVRFVNNPLSSQSITFPTISDQNVTQGSITISLKATSNSNLPVSYDVIVGPASLLGHNLTIDGSGLITVRASQTGNEEFTAATPVERSFYAKKDQLISIDEVNDQVFDDTNLTVNLNANSDSNLAIEYTVVSGAATVDNSTLTVTGTGLISIRASQAGNTHYFPANPVLTNFYSKKNQQINLSPISDITFNEPDMQMALSASASSFLEVSYAITSGQAIVNNNVLSISAPGKISVVANQSGNDHFLPATVVSQTFCVNPPTPEIQVEGTTLTSSSSTGNQWYRNNEPIAQGTGNSLTITEPGEYAVRATINGCYSDLSDPLVITGTENAIDARIQIYPNPTTGNLYIEFLDRVTSTPQLHLYDLAGRELRRQPGSVYSKNEFHLEGLPTGTYLLKITLGGKELYSKVVLK